MDHTLFEAVDSYICERFVTEDEALVQTQQSLIAENIPTISVSPNQGKFLNMLALLCQAKNILEIGTLGGYSTIWLARALPDDGHLITIEFDPHHACVAQQNIIRAGLASKVDIRIGKALELLPQIQSERTEPFDMVFIDADKPPYAEYFYWAMKMARPGTLIVADNVVRQGKVLDVNSSDEKVKGVQRFNEMLASSFEVTATILQTVGTKGYDGMAFAVVGDLAQ